MKFNNTPQGALASLLKLTHQVIHKSPQVCYNTFNGFALFFFVLLEIHKYMKWKWMVKTFKGKHKTHIYEKIVSNHILTSFTFLYNQQNHIFKVYLFFQSISYFISQYFFPHFLLLLRFLLLCSRNPSKSGKASLTLCPSFHSSLWNSKNLVAGLFLNPPCGFFSTSAGFHACLCHCVDTMLYKMLIYVTF